MSQLRKLSNLARRKILNVAEKPSAAKEITKILAKSNSKLIPSLSKYNPIYEFGYNLGGEDVLMNFTSVTGHIMTYQFEEKYSKKYWNIAPHEHLLNDPSKSALAKNLSKLSTSSDTIILWLDCDREGEAIAFEVLDICKKANPNLKVLRAQFSAFTEKEISEAMKTLKSPNQYLAEAVDSRQEIDLRIGAAFTRFQTTLLQNNFNDFHGQVISYGPCQFPTLGFVVERWKKIQAFKSDPFWYMIVQFQENKSSKEVIDFESEKGNFFEKEKADQFFQKCNSNPEATVLDVIESEKVKPRPVPLSTIALQKLGTSKLGLSSHKVMEIAERLYNKGFISYPRTETDMFLFSIDLKGLIYTQKNDALWGSYAKKLLDEDRFKWPKPGGHDDKSHPPIHPVKSLPFDNDEFSSDDRKIYELITRHFLACCSEDARGSETQVKISVADEIFVAKGLKVNEYNWLEVYPYEKWIGNMLPPFTKGQKFNPSKLVLKESKTKPPNHLTENELIGLMDKNGIGTDATIHEHIKTIQDRNYVEKTGNNFVPTKLGEALVTSYENIGIDLWKPTLRASMEASMTEISKGNLKKSDFLATCLGKMEEIFKILKAKQNELIESFKRYYEYRPNSYRPLSQTQNKDDSSTVNFQNKQDMQNVRDLTSYQKKSLHSFGLFKKTRAKKTASDKDTTENVDSLKDKEPKKKTTKEVKESSKNSDTAPKEKKVKSKEKKDITNPEKEETKEKKPRARSSKKTVEETTN